VELEEKVALVTGAGAGIGRAAALRLAREGAAVAVADVNENTGSGTVREIQSRGGRATFVLADVASEADVARMVTFTEEEFGGLDVLVNNTGGVEEPYFPEGDPGHWGRAIDINLRGTMLSIHFGVRAIKKRGEAQSSTSRPWGGSVSSPTTNPSTAQPKRE
jgi:NAD(P)-dependent dehydrogenase (short-subunit alcohol dehydrogenase family)